MKIKFYFDEMMSDRVAEPLRQSGYDVEMAKDVDMLEKDDMSEHLPYATEHERVLVIHDRGFAGLVSKQSNHVGVVCWTGKGNDFGGMIRALKKFADEHRAEEVKGQVFWLS